MEYKELNDLINKWIDYVIKKERLDLDSRDSAKVGFFTAVISTMTNEEREKIANDFNLKRFRDGKEL